MPESTISEVKSLIARNRTEAAIQMLSEQQFSTVDKELILLSNRYHRIQEELRMSVISKDDAELRINQVNHDLLKLTDKIKRTASSSAAAKAASSSGFDRRWLGLLLLPLLVVGYFILPSAAEEPNEKDDEQTDGTSTNTTQPATSAIEVLELADLVAYYPLNGDGKAEEGDFNGEVVHTAKAKDQLGNSESAILFYEPDARIEIYRTLLAVHAPNYSVAFWLKRLDLDVGGTLFGQYASDFGVNEGHLGYIGVNHSIALTPEGGISLDQYPPSGGRSSDISSLHDQYFLPGNDEWVHITVVYEEGEKRLYVNGELKASEFYAEKYRSRENDNSAYFGEINYTVIGARPRRDMQTRKIVYQSNFKGYLSDLFLFSRALSEEEITAVMNYGAES